MSDLLGETPFLGRHHCPGCDPDADPILEILETRWCVAHSPGVGGIDDGIAGFGMAPSGSSEAEAETCRRLQDLLR